MSGIQWPAIVAVILALGLAAAIIIIAVNELTTSGHVTVEEATLLSTILGAVVGALAGYLGAAKTGNGGPPSDYDGDGA